jgi:hypothetical protein
MNVILGQGTAIKEIHNVKKQNLEVNQQFVAQNAEDEKKEDKTKVKKLDEQNKVEIKSDKDKEKEDKKKKKDDQKGSSKKKLEDEVTFSEGNLIDIKV